MIKLRVITPEGVYLNMDVVSISCVSVLGAMTILKNHIPIVAVLKTSKLVLKNDAEFTYAISGGTLSFVDNVATILCESIESKDEIDLERALKAKQKAEENLARAKESFELKQAELALAKAINRINIKQY